MGPKILFKKFLVEGGGKRAQCLKGLVYRSDGLSSILGPSVKERTNSQKLYCDLHMEQVAVTQIRCWEPKSGPHQLKQILLTAEPFLDFY